MATQLLSQLVCPLFLMHALALLVVGVKAAFITHGMNRIDLAFYILMVAIAGGCVAQSASDSCEVGFALSIAIAVVFNMVFPITLMRYLGATTKQAAVIIGMFGLTTAIMGAVVYLMR